MRLATRWLLGTIVFLLIAFLVLGYEFDFKPKREAKSFINGFHQHFNAGDFEQICCSRGYKRPANDLSGWLADMSRVRDSLGKFREVKNSAIRCAAGPVFTCRASYVSVFEKNEATESFELSRASGQMTLFDYSVSTKGMPLLDGIREEANPHDKR